jgi:beta-glucuronidase
MTYKVILFLSGLLTLSWQLSLAQNTDPLLHNAYNRPARLLNGAWHYIIDPYQMGYYNYRYQAFDQMETPNREAYFMNTDPTDKSDRIEYDFDRSPTLNVPGDWNSQAPELLYYEGSVWYQTTFDYLTPTAGQKLLLHFGAVNYLAEVYLNGRKTGQTPRGLHSI